MEEPAAGTVVALPSYAALRDRIAAGEEVVVVYLGGSITEGAMTGPPKGINRDGVAYDYTDSMDREVHSWRAISFHGLREAHETRPGQFRMINAALGATTSELAAYRFDKHVAPHRPDLLFIEFAINDNASGRLSDNPAEDRSIYRTLSSIVDRARALNDDMAIFIPVSTALDLDPDGEWGHGPARRHHINFANQARIPHLDIHRVYFQLPLPDGATVDNVFDGPDNPGNAVHPSPFGHAAYGRAVLKELNSLLEAPRFSFQGEGTSGTLLPYPVHPTLLTAAELPSAEGWEHPPNLEYAEANHVLAGEPMLFTQTPGAEHTLRFYGSSVFLWGVHHFHGTGVTSGRLEAWIDGELQAVFISDDVDGEQGDGRLTRLMPVTRSLDPRKGHELRLRVEPAGEDMPIRVGLHGIGIDQYRPAE